MLLLLYTGTSCGGTFMKQVRMSTTSACSTQGISKCKPGRNSHPKCRSTGTSWMPRPSSINAITTESCELIRELNKRDSSVQQQQQQVRYGVPSSLLRPIFFSGANIMSPILFPRPIFWSNQVRMRQNPIPGWSDMVLKQSFGFHHFEFGSQAMVEFFSKGVKDPV